MHVWSVKKTKTRKIFPRKSRTKKFFHWILMCNNKTAHFCIAIALGRIESRAFSSPTPKTIAVKLPGNFPARSRDGKIHFFSSCRWAIFSIILIMKGLQNVDAESMQGSDTATDFSNLQLKWKATKKFVLCKRKAIHQTGNEALASLFHFNCLGISDTKLLCGIALMRAAFSQGSIVSQHCVVDADMFELRLKSALRIEKCCNSCLINIKTATANRHIDLYAQTQLAKNFPFVYEKKTVFHFSIHQKSNGLLGSRYRAEKKTTIHCTFLTASTMHESISRMWV